MQEKKKGEGDFNMESKTFLHFFSCGLKKMATGASKHKKNKLFKFFFDVVIKERKNTSRFSEN